MIQCQAGHPLDECHPQPFSWPIIEEQSQYHFVLRLRKCPHCNYVVTSNEITHEEYSNLKWTNETVKAFAELLR